MVEKTDKTAKQLSELLTAELAGQSAAGQGYRIESALRKLWPQDCTWLCVACEGTSGKGHISYVKYIDGKLCFFKFGEFSFKRTIDFKYKSIEISLIGGESIGFLEAMEKARQMAESTVLPESAYYKPSLYFSV